MSLKQFFCEKASFVVVVVGGGGGFVGDLN